MIKPHVARQSNRNIRCMQCNLLLLIVLLSAIRHPSPHKLFSDHDNLAYLYFYVSVFIIHHAEWHN